jgi:hypothetical protein
MPNITQLQNCMRRGRRGSNLSLCSSYSPDTMHFGRQAKNKAQSTQHVALSSTAARRRCERTAKRRSSAMTAKRKRSQVTTERCETEKWYTENESCIGINNIISCYKQEVIRHQLRIMHLPEGFVATWDPLHCPIRHE